MLSVDERAYYVDLHALCRVAILLEMAQILHDGLVGHAEHFLDLVYAERATTRIVCTVLEIANVNNVVLSKLRRQREESIAVQSVGRRIEVVAKELKEFCQILGQGRVLIDAELLQERGNHQHDRV